MNKQITVTVNGKPRLAIAGLSLSSIIKGETPCGGHGLCGKCKVLVKAGALSPMSETEKARLSAEEREAGIRLACMAYAEGDCVLETLSSAMPQKEQIVTLGEMPPFALNPIFKQYGVALDIGTTTLAAQLYDANGRCLAQTGRLNGQAVLGSDVLSRMEASLRGERERLAQLIRTDIDEMTEQLAMEAEIPLQAIDALVLTGNTTMLYLLTASDPTALSRAPFDADRLFDEFLTAEALGLRKVSPQTQVFLPPCCSAFLGADTVCALLATSICQKDAGAILVDIGTNGEMALWHKQQLLLCSTAAGPAFEGVGISMGMRGAAGAVDRVTLENGNLLAHVIGDGPAVGICGSGLVDAVACLLEEGSLDESGYLDPDPCLLLSPVSLTGKDIRMVQLAKSAIRAGIETLLHEGGIDASEIETLQIAGGFGKYLNLHSATKIGLLPDVADDRYRVVGNAALGGAAMLLLQRDFHAVCQKMVKDAQIVELSTNPFFVEQYMMGMLF